MFALKRQRPPRKGDQIFGDSLMIEGATPFFLAAKRADLPIMRLLLAHGADPHRAPPRPRTNALMAAAGVGWREGSSTASEKDALEAIKLLWDLGGFDVNAASVAGRRHCTAPPSEARRRSSSFSPTTAPSSISRTSTAGPRSMKLPVSSTARDIRRGRKHRRCCDD